MKFSPFRPSQWIASCLLAALVSQTTSAQTVELISYESTWRYNDTSVADNNPTINLIPGDPAGDWRMLGFDDTQEGWNEGAALFGNDTAGLYPFPYTTPWDRTGSRVTFYARTHFQWSGDAQNVTLESTNYVDDGMVVYLNGVEVGRVRMPGTPGDLPAWNGLADNLAPEGVSAYLKWATVDESPLPLVEGDNVVAVEVHQSSATSSDVVFSLALRATQPFGPTITDQPGSLVITERQSATFRVVVSASPPISYQWFKGTPGAGVLIPDATGPSYLIPDASLADAGSYYVEVTNPLRTTASTAAMLTVDLDKEAPRLDCASVGAGLQTVLASFTERLTPATANLAANFTIVGATILESISVGNGSQVLLNLAAPLTEGQRYELQVKSVTDLASTPNTIPNGSRTEFTATTLVYSDVVLADEPEAYYRFEEAAGETVAVNSGTLSSEADGTYLPESSSTDVGPSGFGFMGFLPSNRAAIFDGLTTSVTANQPLLDSLAAFSLEYWVRPADFTATRSGIIGQNDAVEYGFISPTVIQIWTPNGGSLDTPYLFPRDEWHHVVSTGDGTSLRTYYDGELVATGGGVTANYGSSAFNVNIGGGGVFDGTGNFFTGQIDEVALYRKALNAEQVRAHYRAGVDGGAPAPRITETSLANGTITLRWVCGGRLEAAIALTGPWTAVDSNLGAHSEAASGAQKFFRVVR
jgi:hypothetical protein